MTDARALAERMFDILDNGRYDEFTTVVTEDVVKVELQVRTHSAAERAAGRQAFAAAVPGTRNTITRCVQDGDDFAVEGYGRGTQTGPLQLPQGTILATGGQYEMQFCAFGRVGGDRISGVHIYFDMMSVMAQLGLVPGPRHRLTAISCRDRQSHRVSKEQRCHEWLSPTTLPISTAG
jgi:ketosteroid isomerase-like protein